MLSVSRRQELIDVAVRMTVDDFGEDVGQISANNQQQRIKSVPLLQICQIFIQLDKARVSARLMSALHAVCGALGRGH